jgi:FtsP/CotA-like multicopper oxidase with cupredoxin domain
MAKHRKACSNNSRRTFMATSLATAAVVAGSTAKAAAVKPSPLFKVLKHPDSPLTVDLSTVVNPLLNEQIPRWVDPIVFPKWLPPMSTGSLPQHYSSAVGDVHHGVAPEWFDHPSDWDRFPVQYYEMHHMTGAYRFLPSTMKIPATNFWGYAGRAADGSMVPSALPPMFRFRIGQPAIVRMVNDLPDEMSLHMHGGHWPAHSDGHPNFLILPGESRDYYYPNVVPREHGGNEVGSPFDYSESVSTMWYHDHAVHLTAAHVARGCGGGMCPTLDDLEIDLIKNGVLPGIRGVSDVGPEYRNPYDMPLVIRDDIFDTSGQVQYVSNGHNGYLGNVIRVNGLAYPHMKVEARKYRFRVLIASNARCFRLRLSDNSPFMRIAKDAWMFPKPQQTQAFLGYPALRADIIIDFSKYKPGTEIYLENILPQMDPRGPTSKLEDRKWDRRSRGSAVSPSDAEVHRGSAEHQFPRRHHQSEFVASASHADSGERGHRTADLQLRAEERRLGDQRPVLERGPGERHSQDRFGRGVDAQEWRRWLVAPDPHPPRVAHAGRGSADQEADPVP